MRIDPYLVFKGNTEEVFNFYKAVFGGDFQMVQRFSDMPDDTPGKAKMSEEDLDKIMHISLPVGDSVLMGNDAIDAMGQSYDAGTNFQLSINPSSREEADRLFAGLSEGGTPHMPMQDMFWGAYFGSLTDRYGVQWMINHSTGPQG